MPSNKPSDTASLTLLGGWQLNIVSQRAVAPDYEKGRALLAYLAMEDQLHSREKLSALFWPGSAIRRANLRQILSNLRHVMRDNASPEPYLLVKRDTLRINPHSRLVIDVAAFTAAAPACEANGVSCNSSCLAQMAQQVKRYRGEFMAGFDLPDCPDFADWLQMQREALHRRALALLEKLSACHERLGDYSQALQFALRYAQLEPLDEAACRRIMQLYALNGQYGAALVQFENCARLLKNDLGVLPSEQTRQLAERVRHGEWQARAPRAEPQAPAAAKLRSERRQVTVLYCELSVNGVDDPDEAMALLSQPQARCVAIIGQFSGHIVQTHGGGLLAYFGYPQAHEYAARHAVQAAWAVTHEASQDVEIRAGVHTGLIICGDNAAMPDTVGRTSRLAIQLRAAAGRNEVIISGDTQRLVSGYFHCSGQPLPGLPGLAPAFEIFKVQGESGALTRLEAAAQLSPLRGRQAELAQLQALWGKARRGRAHAVLIHGEAGIGKSRLLRALKKQLGPEPHAIRELRCFPEFSQSPLRPLIVMFELLFDFQPADTAEQKLGKLVRYLDEHGVRMPPEDMALVARLLALPLGSAYPPSSLSPQKAKARTSEVVLDLLQATASKLPTLLLVEDLHWIDPSTLELLSLHVKRARQQAVLTLFTARPEFRHPWKRDLSATLTLGPLTDGEVAALVNFVNQDIAPETVHSIVKRADGVPLFAEEMARMVALGAPASIPATLQDLLSARVDRLNEAKTTAQLAATIGREFDLNLLQKVSAQAPGSLENDLIALHDAGLIVTLGASVIQFKHALLQEAAYQSQSRADRQASHRRVAQALQSDFPDVLASRPELLAQHLAASGDLAQSLAYWIKAGQRAALQCANLESIAHFRSGLQLVESLPAGQQRDAFEFKLLAGICPVLYATQGYGCEEARQFSERIATLNERVGDSPKLFQAKWALMVSTIASSSSRGMPQAALQLLNMAQDDPLKKMAAHTLAALSSFWLGDFASARRHDEQAVALYHPDQRQSLVRQFGSDLIINCASYLACSLYFLGYPDQAQRACQRMLKQARTLAHPHTLAQALSFAALLQRWLNLPQQALTLSAQAIALSREHDFHLWLACGEMTHGWALVQTGAPHGMAEIESAIAAMRSALGGISIVFLSSRIEACIFLKQYDQALEWLTQALADAQKTGDGHFLAELHRLRGVCLLETSPIQAADARACFEQALAISGQQQAKSLALRAATSLARLGQQQGNPEAANQRLNEICSSFSEGFESCDLKEAARLLPALA